MTNLQSAKSLVRDYYAAIDADPRQALARYCTPDAIWRGYHPFNEIHDPAEVAARFWTPLRTSLTRLQRRMDLFMAGENHLPDGGTWVASMGHLMGLFDSAWLDIPPTRKIVMLRYAEFIRVDGDKISDTAMFFDIPHLMMQAGLNPFPPQTGAQLVQPGPMTHDGVMFNAQDPEAGRKTLAAIEFMIDDIRDWKGREEEGLLTELPRSWNDDMIWWGPAGIGATYTIERYAEQHAGPFREGFTDRIFNGHVARIAEGSFGGFFGWPNLTLTPTGGFMGMPATGKPSDMRVIDMYRRAGDKLTENWIFIDLLHFWKQQGLDVLARLPYMRG
ncbi:MAG: nuclear transport factor 2 family protein [Pseudomonadota bacterium]